MNSTIKTAKRRIKGFEPCGPIGEMINNSLRSPGATFTSFVQCCIAEQCRERFPKLYAEWQILQKEGKA